MGPPVSTLSGIAKAFGTQFKTMKKAFSPSALGMFISIFSHSYCRLPGNITPALKQHFYTFAGMMKFWSRGGSFENNPYGWHNDREEIRLNLDPETQPKLYDSFFAECIIDTPACPQNFLLMRNPSVPESIFKHHVSSIAKNIINQPTYITKNMERLLRSPSEEEIEQMENPNSVSKHESLLKFLIEDCGKCFRTEYMCIKCAMSISNSDDAIRHIHAAHKQNCNELVFADWNEHRRQREEDEKNKLRQELAEARAEIARLRNGE